MWPLTVLGTKVSHNNPRDYGLFSTEALLGTKIIIYVLDLGVGRISKKLLQLRLLYPKTFFNLFTVQSRQFSTNQYVKKEKEEFISFDLPVSWVCSTLEQFYPMSGELFQCFYSNLSRERTMVCVQVYSSIDTPRTEALCVLVLRVITVLTIL